MSNEMRVTTSVTTVVSITPATGWFTDRALTTPATFPATVAATTSWWTAASGAYTLSAKFAGREYGGTVQVESGGVANTNIVPQAQDATQASGLAASRPSASAFGSGYWLSTDTGSLDYSDGITWTSGVGGVSTLSGAFMSPTAALQSAQDNLTLQVLGDSTGVGTTRWPYLLAQSLAAEYPAYKVQIKNWNDTNQSYDASTVIQSGTGGAQAVTFSGSGDSVQAMGDGTSVTGDLDVQVYVNPTHWLPTTAAAQTLASRFGAAPHRCWRFQINGAGGNAGKLYLDWSADGTNLHAAALSSVATSFVDGTAGWVRVTLQVNNAGSTTVTFYTGTDGINWTQLGTPQTTAGTTSLFNDPTQTYELGARSVNGEPLSGSILEVRVLNGLGGLNVVPRYPMSWAPVDTMATFSGAPILTVLNGSVSGMGQGYFTDTTRLPKINPSEYLTAATLLSCSHNDGYARGPAYWANWDTFWTNLKARNTLTNLVYVGQNPRTSPAGNIRDHGVRRCEGAQWAARNSFGFIDVYRSFTESALGLAALTNTDGIHPSDAAGSPLWRDVILAAINKRG